MPETYTRELRGSAALLRVNSRRSTRFASPPVIHAASPQSVRAKRPVRKLELALEAAPLLETTSTFQV